MIEANLHPREEERLSLLRVYDLLDTEFEEAYDDLTKIASDICGTSISLVSLVDRDRQWFKSRVGLDATETSREIAFCSHAILQDGIFEIPDALEDKRFHDNPLVTGEVGIRFYAGAPLVSPEGLPMGTLCVIDQEPRKLTERQRETLAALARQVVALFELRDKLSRLAFHAEELERSNEELDRFASVASHDLQEPLRKIRAFGSRLRDRLDDQVDEKSDQYLERMEDASGRMQVLITGLLELARVRTKARPFERVDLGEIAKQVLFDLEGRLEDSDGTVHIGPLPQLDGESLQMRQLFQNLIGNALKFRADDRSPIVEIEANEYATHERLPHCRSPLVELIIRDNGIGFAPEYAERIFGTFERLHGREKYDGSGVGLSICQRIAEYHKGAIWAESSGDGGASFHVLLPQDQLASEPRASGQMASEQLAAEPSLVDAVKAEEPEALSV